MAAYTKLGAACLASIALLFASRPLASQSPRQTLASGVYTAAQAERGALVITDHCIECHGDDLEGLEGPQLVGSRFTRSWRARNLNELFQKIREAMPKGAANSVTDQEKLDALAYLLRANGFPAGSAELKPDATVLATIALGLSTDTPRLPGAIIKATGCLKEAPDNQWVLTGDDPLRLMSVYPRPTAHVGHTVVVTGLFVSSPAGDALNVISLEATTTTCAG